MMDGVATDPGLTTVTSYGRSAGSARVRVFEWLDRLDLDVRTESYLDGRDNGIGTLLARPGEAIAAERRLRALPSGVGAGTVLLARQASPFSNGGVEERILRSAGHGVYDFDDALMHTPSSLRERLWSKRSVWRRSVMAADTVIAGNEFLAEEARRWNRDVHVIPSCVEPSLYTVKSEYALSGAPRAVWVGSPSTEAYLQLIAAPLRRLHERTGLRLSLISAGDADLGALTPMVDRIPWTESGFAEHLVTADFGLMPLDDTPWTRGKCAYKLLQYGAAALPLVGSPVGVNAEVLSASDGLAPLTPDDWVDAIEELIDEPAARRADRGRAARQTVLRDFAFDAWQDRWRRSVGV